MSSIYKYILIFGVIFIFIPKSYGQEGVIRSKAVEAFHNKEYFEASRLWELLKSKGKANEDDLRFLGISYMKIGNLVAAKSIFHSNYSNDTTGESLGLYLDCIGAIYDLDKLKTLVDTLHIKHVNQKNVLQSYIKNLAYIETHMTDSVMVRVKPLNMSKNYAEFCPVIANGNLFFTTDFPIKDELNQVSNLFHVESLSLKSWKKFDIADTTILKQRGTLFNLKVPNGYNYGPLCFNKQGDTVFFGSNNLVKVKNNKYYKNYIYVAGVDSGKVVSTPILLPFQDQKYNYMHPSLSIDGRYLYFASDMEGGEGGYDIYRVERKGNLWSEPQNLRSINTAKNDVFPFCSSNNILYFSSNGHPTFGGLDIYYVFLDFESEVKSLGYPINTSGDDFGIYVDASENNGIYSSNKTTNNKDDLFEFRDIRNKIQSITFEPIYPSDYLVNIDSTELVILNNNGVQIKNVFVYKNEKIAIVLPANNAYSCYVKHALLNSDTLQFYVRSDLKKQSTVKIHMYRPDLGIDILTDDDIHNEPKLLKGYVKNVDSKEPVETDVVVYVDGELVDFLQTNNVGAFECLLENNKTYQLKIVDYRYVIFEKEIQMDTVDITNNLVLYVQENNSVENADQLKVGWEDKKSKLIFSGTITDSLSNNGINALVTLKNIQNSSLVYSSYANEKGSFIIDIKDTGWYILEITHLDYPVFHTKIHFSQYEEKVGQYVLYRHPTDFDSLNVDWQNKAKVVTVSGQILDIKKNQPLVDIISFYIGKDTIPDLFTVSDLDGFYQVELKQNRMYRVVIKDFEYGDQIKVLNTSLLNDSNLYLNINYNFPQKSNDLLDSLSMELANTIELNKQKYSFTILDTLTKLPLESMIGIYKNGSNFSDEILLSDIDGTFDLSLPMTDQYALQIVTQNYSTKFIDLSRQKNKGANIIFLSKTKEAQLAENKYKENSVVLNNSSVYHIEVIHEDTLLKHPIFVALYNDTAAAPFKVMTAYYNKNISFLLENNKNYRLSILENGYLPIFEDLPKRDTFQIINRKYILRKAIDKKIYDSLQTTIVESKKNLKYKVYGLIYDSLTRLPIKCQLYVYDQYLNKVDSTWTDLMGKYTLFLDSTFKGKLVVNQSGFRNYETILKVRQGRYIYHNNIALSPLYDIDNIPQYILKKRIRKKEIFKSKISIPLFVFYFEKNQYKLSEPHLTLIDSINATIERHGVKKIIFMGYSDTIGTAASNLLLAEKRIDAVASFLLKNNPIVNTTKKALGEGGTRAPIDEKNRRVEVYLKTED